MEHTESAVTPFLQPTATSSHFHLQERISLEKDRQRLQAAVHRMDEEVKSLSVQLGEAKKEVEEREEELETQRLGH